ncbi:hypothetical protein WEI85_00515 [Actinomycetes bacterium KLBMP 9797]
MHVRCVNPMHDHITTADPATGAELAVPAPMVCADCHQPAHYDYGSERYRHDDPEAPPCFLISDSDGGDDGSTPCIP